MDKLMTGLYYYLSWHKSNKLYILYTRNQHIWQQPNVALMVINNHIIIIQFVKSREQCNTEMQWVNRSHKAKGPGSHMVTAPSLCACMLNHWLEWDKWLLTNFDHDRQLFNTLIPPSYESTVSCGAVTVDCISRSSGPVRIVLRYTTVDIGLVWYYWLFSVCLFIAAILSVLSAVQGEQTS